MKLPAEDTSGKDKRENGIVEEKHVRCQRCSKQLGTRLARASGKLWLLERSSRNLFHDKKRKTSGVTYGDDFVVTGTKGSLLELKKELESACRIEASIIGAGSTKSIKALNRRICW